MTRNHSDDAKVFKAFCDEQRLAIFEMLRQGERCACELLEQLNISQSTLSHHMKVLCDSGVVASRKDGKWTRYSINKYGANSARDLLQFITTEYTNQEDCSAMNQPKTQLYVLTGFLGSGKTTILRKLLENLKTEGVGVIQNEFGKLSVDGDILRDDDIKMVELSRGSIFCSCLKLSFVQALAEMSKQGLRYVFVESSGLGDPSNMEEILSAVQVLAGDCYDFKGVICLVDAVNFMSQLGDLETVERQLKHCHLAIITKTDLADEETIRHVTEDIRAINPVCPILHSAKADLPLDFLQQNLLDYQWAQTEDSTNVPEDKPKTISLWCNETVPKEKLEQFIHAIAPHVYRVKGFFNLQDLGWQQVDLVGQRIDVAPCPPAEQSHLVLISKIGPAIIKKAFDAWNSLVGVPMDLKN